MNTFTITTPNTTPVARDARQVAGGRRFRSAAFFGAVAAVVAFAVVNSDSADATPAACPRVSQAWPSGDYPDSPGWPGETQSVDMFAVQTAGFGWPSETPSVDTFAEGGENSFSCL